MNKRLMELVNRKFVTWYGKKGMGFINNPSKAIYNKVYSKTTTSVDNIIDGIFDTILMLVIIFIAVFTIAAISIIF